MMYELLRHRRSHSALWTKSNTNSFVCPMKMVKIRISGYPVRIFAVCICTWDGGTLVLTE